MSVFYDVEKGVLVAQTGTKSANTTHDPSTLLNSPTEVVFNLVVGTLSCTTAQEIDFYFQTTHDDGATWRDLGNIHFAAEAATASKSFSHVRPQVGQTNIAASDGAIADNTVASTVPVGDQVRLKLLLTGTASADYNATFYGRR